MECWAARSGGREAVTEFPVTDLGFQGGFSAGLGVELRFCLPSISPFHNLCLSSSVGRLGLVIQIFDLFGC
jgi:hypothetical protein